MNYLEYRIYFKSQLKNIKKQFSDMILNESGMNRDKQLLQNIHIIGDSCLQENNIEDNIENSIEDTKNNIENKDEDEDNLSCCIEQTEYKNNLKLLDYNIISNRVLSFNHTSYDKSFIKLLADNGFYCVVEPIVCTPFKNMVINKSSLDFVTKCVYCNIEINCWNPSLNPNDIHTKLSPFCDKVIKNNFNDLNKRISTYTNVNFEPDLINQLAKSGFVCYNHKGGSNNNQEITLKCFCCFMICKLHDILNINENTPLVFHNKINPNCEFVKQSLTTNVCDDSRMLCDICNDNDKNICFLPCSHISTCKMCSKKINNLCPVCQTNIEKKITVFIT
ncbi:iap-like protein [Dasineura jujubifolia toursvirus 2a]|nr:iap-like protein [Dasineura jujubifolia toursvirus 2a]